MLACNCLRNLYQVCSHQHWEYKQWNVSEVTSAILSAEAAPSSRTFTSCAASSTLRKVP